MSRRNCSPQPRAATPEGAREQRWSRLLNKADKDPASVLQDPRCLRPRFIARFFDLCDGKALEARQVAPEYAEAALRLAEKSGDRHNLNLAQGIAVHSLIANTRWQDAAERLRSYRQEALDCCNVCVSDWLRRQGDLLVEARDPVLSGAFLELSAEVLGESLGDDARGRILFVRGIAHHYLGHRGQALGDAGEALRLLSLATPRGYFMDTIAFVGCFLQNCDERRHYEAALACLTHFRERLKGRKGWNEVRDRLRWVLAQVEAWLGHPRRARATLERTRSNHLKHSPHRYALAIAIDEALIYCMYLPDVHIRSIQRILKSCKQHLKLEADIRRNLRQAARKLGQQRLYARQILVSLRRSFIVPVPGLLAADNLPSASARARKAAGKG